MRAQRFAALVAITSSFLFSCAVAESPIDDGGGNNNVQDTSSNPAADSSTLGDTSGGHDVAATSDDASSVADAAANHDSSVPPTDAPVEPDVVFEIDAVAPAPDVVVPVMDVFVPPPVDVQVPPPVDVVVSPPDVPTTRSGIYGPCQSNANCAAGTTCRTESAGAYCTSTCARDSDCSGGVCLGQSCYPSCQSGHATGGHHDCDQYGGACAAIDTNTQTFACVPSCWPGSGMPAGFGTCSGGTTCDPNTGFCLAAPLSGVAVGGACTQDSDCRTGVCWAEVTAASPYGNGFINGYCVAFGRYPAQSAFVANQPVPQANCPPGSVVFPSQSTAEGDVTPCLLACSANSDCRSGYRCLHQPITASTQTSNGACVPVDCSQSGMRCPNSRTCYQEMSGGVSYGVCEM